MQLLLSAEGGDVRKCRECETLREWDSGRGWNGRQCPECRREYNRQYHAANADALRERMRQRYAENPDALREYNRQYHAANAEAIRERKRQRRAANPEAEREKQRQRRAANPEAERESKRQRRAANPEKVRELDRLRYAANPEAKRESSRKWRAANPERAGEYQRQYRAANPEVIRKSSSKSNRNRRARKAGAVCQHGPGCFDQAIASQPQRCAVPGCRRRKRLEADHIVPLAKDGLDCKDNLQLLCAYHNASKGAADPVIWAQRNGRLL